MQAQPPHQGGRSWVTQNPKQNKEDHELKKAELQALIDRFHFQIIRHEITREVFGFWLDSENLIPELDILADGQEGKNLGKWGVYFFRDSMFGLFYRYTIYPPKSWLDLWGLR